jgi:predicted RNase H-like HicB family nuclease
VELTITVCRACGGYDAVVRELTGCNGSAPTLQELGDVLEQAVARCLGDPGAILIHPTLRLGELPAAVLLSDRYVSRR